MILIKTVDLGLGGGIGSGPWMTLETRLWMQRLCVKEHYVIKDGNISFI